ncbi:type I restriction-modification system subunit M [Galactobacillus timonensis]|uniref:type I restriction-modification system subunit M n=1 Tax=Galactobacillus timonensis TaxID=2041840 RepID=UPI000C857340|nr:type I restriction-modification system subunit M [Galactobacillus timonensis]
MNKQQLSAKIWASANGMRSKIDASEYKDYILGFIFYKYLSEREEQWLKSRGYDEDSIKKYVNEDAPDNYSGKSLMQQNLGYFIAYENLFSTWIKMGSDFSVGNVRSGLSAFSRLISPSHQKVYANIFNTLETGLSKLGENTKSQTTAVSGLIHLIDTIPMDGKQDYDLLGYIYGDLIGKFASSAGKKAGEFYTPHEVSLLMAYIIADHLKGREEIKIYDPTSGSASLLLNIGRACAHYLDDQNKIRYYAQELNANTYNLTRMNLVMRGILPDNIVTRNADTLEEDWPYFDESDPKSTYEPLYVDAVVRNPPYSQSWDPKNKENDPRFAGYGLAPKSKADYAFLLHDLFHLKPNGIMAIVLPHGVLFRGGEEGEIRRNLIERNNIDAIIGLPANIFFGTGIPTIIMILRQKRENTDVLIVDASKGFEKEGKNNKLRACDIRKIVDTVTKRMDVANYSRRVSLEEIRRNDYNLNIPRYVDSSEKAESWDIYASMFGGIPEKELHDFDAYWSAFPSLKNELFKGHGAYLSLHTDDIVGAIHRNKDVQAFENRFKDAFADYDSYLEHALIDQAESISVPRTEDLLRDDLFRRFEGFSLLDPYQAFEIFSKEYEVISGDLELIQAEGMQAVRSVDPNMVSKKKDGTDGAMALS